MRKSYTVLYVMVSFALLFGQNLERVQNKNRHQVYPIRSAGIAINSASEINAPAITSGDSIIISSLIDRISEDTLFAELQNLVGFTTRDCFSQNHQAVIQHVIQKYKSYGITDVERDTFTLNGSACANIIATIPGTKYPDKIILIGGHYDSTNGSSNPESSAQGADDDGSGTVTAMEAARIIMASGFRSPYTLQFVAWDAEEKGIVGSDTMAARYLAAKKNILLVVNIDMIGYSLRPANAAMVNITGTTAPIRTAANQLVKMFSSLQGTLLTAGSGPDDHRFADRGYNTMWYFENELLPYVNTSGDSLYYYNHEYFKQCVRSVISMFIYTALATPDVQTYTLRDIGTGNSVRVSNITPPLRPGYKYLVQSGTAPGSYSAQFITTDSIIVVANLSAGQQAYINIAIIDSTGKTGSGLELSIVPQQRPHPVACSTQALIHAVRLTWGKNTDVDLSGYAIYRSADSLTGYQKINVGLLSDSTYIDYNIISGQWYYYRVRAVDNTSLESDAVTVSGRGVFLNKGILFIDAAIKGSGLLTNFSANEVDSFYTSVLQGFTYVKYDIQTKGPLTLSLLGPYSTVVIARDESASSGLSANIQEIARQYLAVGGKLCISSHKAICDFYQCTTQQMQYAAGSFIFDCLKIQDSRGSILSRCNGAEPLQAGLPYLTVDTVKALRAGGNNYLKNIDVFHAATGAVILYRYNSLYDSSSMNGQLQGLPVAVQYLGNDNRTTAIGLPLFFIERAAVKAFYRKVLAQDYGEPLAVTKSANRLPVSYRLHQNYPNPFNPVTTIQYELPRQAHVTLRVFTILGTEVMKLADEVKPAGFYQATVNGVNLASGVYLYRLDAGEVALTRKFILLK